jgi:hypothetical protein
VSVDDVSAALPGPLDVDEVLALVTAGSEPVAGGLVDGGALAELAVEVRRASVSPQTRRAYAVRELCGLD